jgi:hypothetical protein
MERAFIEKTNIELTQSNDGMDKKQVEELSDQKNVSSHDEKTRTTRSMKRKNPSNGNSFHRKDKHRINSLSDDGMDKKEVEELNDQENVSHDEKTSTTKSMKRKNPSNEKSFRGNKKQILLYIELTQESDDGMDKKQVEKLSDQENVSSHDEKTRTTKSMKRKNPSNGKSFHRKDKHRINSLSDDGMDKKEVEELSDQENVSSHDEITSTTKSMKRKNPSDGKSFHRNKKTEI